MKLSRLIPCLAPRLALVGLAALIPASAATAEENWYAAMRGGLSMAENSSLDNAANGLNGYSNHGSDFAFGAGFGYDFGDVRLEGEFLHLRNGVDKFNFTNDGGLGAGLVGVNDATAGNTRATAGMFNLIYDIDFGSRVTPYLGAGLGWGKVDYNNYDAAGVRFLDDSDGVAAYQLIAGLRATISDAADMTIGYRYFGTENPKLIDTLGRQVDSDFHAHVFLVGLIWKFGAKTEVASTPEPIRTAVQQPVEPEPMAEEVQRIEPAAGPEPVGPFIVYFDWDSADLTSEARTEIERAAAAAKDNAPVKLLLKGHADSSGPDYYNTPLSERRAKAVRDALVAAGVPADSIGSWGYGEGELAVWTDDNVRERMNRRVEIIFE